MCVFLYTYDEFEYECCRTSHVCKYLHVYIHVIYIHAMNTYTALQHTYMPAYMHTCVHTYTCGCITHNPPLNEARYTDAHTYIHVNY